jgi:hypothetical protein
MMGDRSKGLKLDGKRPKSDERLGTQQVVTAGDSIDPHPDPKHYLPLLLDRPNNLQHCLSKWAYRFNPPVFVYLAP